MGTVNESIPGRVTLRSLVNDYGFELDPPSADKVTITSITDDASSARPGSLVIVQNPTDRSELEVAQFRGAYAIMLPAAEAGSGSVDCDVPVLYASPTPRQLGDLAGGIAGNPSSAMAVFAVAGSDADEVRASVIRIADFLHMLGNPVAVISAAGSRSLERQLPLNHPIGVLDVENTLAVCAEDGATAVILAMEASTLKRDSLQAVEVDVLATVDDVDAADGGVAVRESLVRRYGFSLADEAPLVTVSRESDELAAQSGLSHGPGGGRRLSLAIAMSLAAGVRRGNIRGALKVSRELG
nr:UDP-N-acetylmuramyl peptide synthase [uncultured Bifidobacterium sp.]